MIQNNLNQNSSMFNTSYLNKPKINISAGGEINTDINISSKPAGEVLGYAVDKDGYFTAEFNKEAGIPQDFKIHSETMMSLVRTTLRPDKYGSPTFKSIDIAKTAKNAYTLLSNMVGKDTLASHDSFSMDEIAAFSQGMVYNRDTFEVDKVLKTQLDFNAEAIGFNYKNKNRKMVGTLFFITTEDSLANRPAIDIFNNNNGGKESNMRVFIDPHGEKYTNKDGSITKGGLLAAVISANLDVRSGETTRLGDWEGYGKPSNYSSGEPKYNDASPRYRPEIVIHRDGKVFTQRIFEEMDGMAFEMRNEDSPDGKVVFNAAGSLANSFSHKHGDKELKDPLSLLFFNITGFYRKIKSL